MAIAVRSENLKEGDDARHTSETANRGNPKCQNSYKKDFIGMEDHRQSCLIDNPYASSGKHLLQHGKGETCVRALGEAEGSIREEVKFLETHTHSAVVQHADEGDRGSNESL